MHSAPGDLPTGLHTAAGLDNKNNDEHLYIKKYNLFSLFLRLAANPREKEREGERERERESRRVYECIRGLDEGSLHFDR